jgi:hypothetical protein
MNALLCLALLAAPLDERWTFEAGGSPSVEVSNITGEIAVERGGSSVEVQASARDAGDFTVRASQDGARVNVAVECLRGRSRDCREGGPIALRLKVPAGTSVNATNVTGPIRVAGVEGPQSLANVSGSVQSEGSAGALQIQTVSGRVRLAPQRLKEAQVSSVSGAVLLELPRGAGATVSLASLSGRIRGRGGRGDSSRRTFGDGAADVAVSTVSGSVEVEER